MSGPVQLCILSSSYLIFGCCGGAPYRQQVPPSSCHHSLRFRLLLRCRRLTRRRDMSNRACWLCMGSKWIKLKKRQRKFVYLNFFNENYISFFNENNNYLLKMVLMVVMQKKLIHHYTQYCE